MTTKRMVRVNELIKRTLADDLYRELSGSGFDLAAVTITRVNTSPDLRDAYVSVSIFGHEGQREGMLGFLESNRAMFQRELSSKVKLRYTPRLHFRLDESIEQGDHVLSIINAMEADGAMTDPANDPKDGENESS